MKSFILLFFMIVLTAAKASDFEKIEFQRISENVYEILKDSQKLREDLAKDTGRSPASAVDQDRFEHFESILNE